MHESTCRINSMRSMDMKHILRQLVERDYLTEELCPPSVYSTGKSFAPLLDIMHRMGLISLEKEGARERCTLLVNGWDLLNQDRLGELDHQFYRTARENGFEPLEAILGMTKAEFERHCASMIARRVEGVTTECENGIKTQFVPQPRARIEKIAFTY